MSQGERAGFLAYLSHPAVTHVAAKDASEYRHGVAYRPMFGLYPNYSTPYPGHIQG